MGLKRGLARGKRQVAAFARDANSVARPARPSGRKAADFGWASRAGFEIMVHFAGAPANIYQLKPWLDPLGEVDRRHGVLIVTQNPDTYLALRQLTSLAVAHAPNNGDLDALVAGCDFKLAFYISHHSSNFRNMRHGEMLHVSIGHGESDKLYMASNQAKSYEYVFVAGDAAVERYRRHLINLDEQRLIKIGRPQLDFARPCLVDTTRPTVLYAPTWEGDRPTMQYSSVTTYGPELLAELLDPAHGFRVVLRPHPFTGKEDQRTAERLQKMREILAEAQVADPVAGHVENSADDFPSLALGADILIADNSAVLIDFLATGKPYIVTTPENEAAMSAGGVAQAGYDLDWSTVSGVGAQLREVLDNDLKRGDRLALAGHYYGDIAPGAATERFLQATESLIRRRDEFVGAGGS